jgi:hypothetical protein
MLTETTTVTIKWNKPVREGAVGRVVRYSKCGKFKIERREYDLPFVTVAFVVIDLSTGKKISEEDSLADAREYVNDVVAES